jgi:two-component system response regulator AtoC
MRTVPKTPEAETRRATAYRSDGGGAAADRTSLRLVVYGPGTFTAYPLPPAGALTLGRSNTADVLIDDPQASRQHARLHLGDAIELEDLGSANGTKCRNVALAPNERRPIAPGDVFAIGASLLVVQAGAGPLFLWTESAFLERLQRECLDAERAGGELALFHLATDEVTPAPPVEDILRGTLGTQDVVAALAPHHFEVLVPRLSAIGARELGDRLCRQLHDLGFAPRLTQAAYPHDGTTAAMLLQRSRADSATASTPAPAAAAPASMARLEALVARVAPGNINVLLLGETGVGKEVLAERIHQQSPRAKSLLLRLHCAALSESLLESELFGHERGAFTGAVKDKRGLLETADGGTVFLDEVGELPLAIQVKLLRVIEDRIVQRVGGLTPRRIDVRFIAATNRNIEAEVARGAFRQDLYYRLNGISLVIPPLRERTSEIEPLAKLFLRLACEASGRAVPALSAAASTLLKSRDWPGNIRELRNVCERALLLCAGELIEPEHFSLSAAVAEAAPSSAPSSDEREQVIQALAQCAGNQSRAAKLLGISRKTLVARLDAFGLPRPRKPSRPG